MTTALLIIGAIAAFCWVVSVLIDRSDRTEAWKEKPWW